jgi:hypothetical protein
VPCRLVVTCQVDGRSHFAEKIYAYEANWREKENNFDSAILAGPHILIEFEPSFQQHIGRRIMTLRCIKSKNGLLLGAAR